MAWTLNNWDALTATAVPPATGHSFHQTRSLDSGVAENRTTLEGDRISLTLKSSPPRPHRPRRVQRSIRVQFMAALCHYRKTIGLNNELGDRVLSRVRQNDGGTSV